MDPASAQRTANPSRTAVLGSKSTEPLGVPLKRRVTALFRSLPDFLIVGGIRCGTTSLYRYLCEHPAVVPAIRKEVNYFNKPGNFGRGPGWYRANFPAALTLRRAGRWVGRERAITGEATPAYLMHPEAGKRIEQLAPAVKLIVLLRNPVDRAWSNYWNARSKNRVRLPFEQTVENELSGLEANGIPAFYPDSTISSKHFLFHGLYAIGLNRYFDLFDRKQILVLCSEDFFQSTERVFQQLVEFLQMPPWAPTHFPRLNRKSSGEMGGELRKRLGEFFTPFNWQLFQLVGQTMNWEN